jgi:hypothetical protein
LSYITFRRTLSLAVVGAKQDRRSIGIRSTVRNNKHRTSSIFRTCGLGYCSVFLLQFVFDEFFEDLFENVVVETRNVVSFRNHAGKNLILFEDLLAQLEILVNAFVDRLGELGEDLIEYSYHSQFAKHDRNQASRTGPSYQLEIFAR